MLERANIVIRGRTEHTKRRQQIDILLKKAMKGDRHAKLKLYKEFGIRLYSSEAVNQYAKERLSQEYASSGKGANNGPTVITRRGEPKGLIKNVVESHLRQDRSKSSTSRGKPREKAKQMVKRI
jgi:hypothetical protein